MTITSLAGILITAAVLCGPRAASAQDKGKEKADELGREAQTALQTLYAKTPIAKQLGSQAQAILIFPEVKKAGLGVGGQYGEGVLLERAKPSAYYKTTGASVGLQVGGQKYGYAMFFMNAGALDQFKKASGFEVGVGPSVVLMDEGKAKNMTTTTMKDDIYAFVFGQKGLMAGLGIQGNKITQITPD
jgi:lipid-binding SYLF domain-containing protein